MKRIFLFKLFVLISVSSCFCNSWETVKERRWEGWIYDLHSFNFDPDPDPTNCGIDDNPILTELEAVFLNEYLKNAIKLNDFNFYNKRILFVTGSGGGKLGSKSEYFDKVREWKEKHNAKISTGLFLLDEKQKEEYGYDAIVTYWVKVLTPKSIKKLLEKTKENFQDVIAYLIETTTEFPGGDDAMYVESKSHDVFSDSIKFTEYIYTNIHYPLIDLVNGVEGMAVYKYGIDSVLNIRQIEIVRSSGSSSLDMEGRRLLWTIPVKKDNWPAHDITIYFKLEDNKIYRMEEVLEDIPVFPGGAEEMVKFISTNLRWPLEYAESAIVGTIICGVIIEKDGSIGAVEIVRPLERYIDAEAMRVIKRMPQWKPGKKDGKPVRVYYLVPLRIQLLS